MLVDRQSRWRRSSRLFGVLVVWALAMMTGIPEARAGLDQLCVPQAEGVPGAQPTYPKWWDTSLDEDDREIGWTGATRIYDDGLIPSDIASGRALWDKDTARLFFQFEINGDPTLDANQDILSFMVSDDTGAFPELYIHFTPMNDCAASPTTCMGLGKAMSGSSVKYSQASPSGTGPVWSNLNAINPSTTFTVTHPWVELEQHGSSYRWIIKFALTIPVDTVTGEALANQRFYANTLMYMQGTSGTIAEFPLLCDPSAGPGNDCQLVYSSNPNLPEAIPWVDMSTLWTHVLTGDVSSCDGIDMHRTLVGSNFRTRTGFIPGTSVEYDFPSPWIPNNSGAKLRAGFHNDTLVPLDPGDITATFRIANWGFTWGGGATSSFHEITSANLGGAVSAGGYAGATGEGKIETATFFPQSSGIPITSSSQVLHVQLTANTQNIKFKRDSIHRNMAIVRASVFRRPAELNMSGRPLSPGHTAHEVYLLTRTFHMPTPEECTAASQKLLGCMAGPTLLLSEQDADNVAVEDAPVENPVGEGVIDPAAIDQGIVKGGKPPVESKAQGLSIDQLPRYTISAFVDTGATLNLPGAPATPVLESVAGISYYIEHEGAPSEGFEHYLHLAGSEPVAGVDGLYHVSVPEGAVLAMANTVRVVDSTQTTCATPPQSHEFMSAEEALVQAEALMGSALEGSLSDAKVLDLDFGCAPPPLRSACTADTCVPHNPVSYIEGSTYVGEWTSAEIEGAYAEVAKMQAAVAQGVGHGELPPEGLAAGGAALGEGEVEGEGEGEDEDEDEDLALDLDSELSDLPQGMQDACCVQARVDPGAGRRGAARTLGLVALLLLLRRGRRRRRR